MALAIVLLEDRLLEGDLLFLRPLPALGLDIVAPHGSKHTRCLLAAHHRDARRRPHPEESWTIGAAAHAVVAGAITAAHDHRELWDRNGRDGGHHLRAVARYPACLVLATDHEARD